MWLQEPGTFQAVWAVRFCSALSIIVFLGGLIGLPKSGVAGGVMEIIKTPLGLIILFVIMLVLAGLSIASAISGSLTAAAVSAAGLLVVVVLLVVVKVMSA